MCIRDSIHSQCSTADDCRSKPHPHQEGWRHHYLHQRCRLGARRVSPADQYRARQWPRSVLLTIQKAGSASTLNVIAGIKALLPQIKATVPPQLQITPLADQSIFVRSAISGVVREIRSLHPGHTCFPLIVQNQRRKCSYETNERCAERRNIARS